MITRYGFMEDEEFLRICSEKRALSPIIEELCQRLEYYLYEGDIPDKDDGVVDENTLAILNCPICETTLKVSGTEIEGHLQIQVNS